MKPCDYHHGGELEAEFKRLGVEPRQVIDFSINLSSLGPPKSLSERWAGLGRSLGRYPDKLGSEINRYYQDRYKLDPRRVLPLNGSIEGIYLWPKGLSLKKVLLPVPCFFDYHAGLEQADVDVESFLMSENSGFQLQGIAQAIAGHDGVILGSPNNPTGRAVPKDQILALVRQFPQTQFLVDQAFVELTADPHGLQLFDLDEPNLWVLHSLTKEYCIPGLRAGAMICPTDRTQELAGRLPPWRIGSVVLEAVKLLQEEKGYCLQLKELVDRERVRVFEALSPLGSFTLFPTDANFFLAKYRGTDSFDRFLAQALSSGFALRDCCNFEGLQGPYFRFAIRSVDENNQLINFFRTLPN